MRERMNGERERKRERKRKRDGCKHQRKSEKRQRVGEKDGKVEGASNAVFGWSTLFLFSQVSPSLQRTHRQKEKIEMVVLESVRWLLLLFYMCVAIHLLQ